MTRIRKAQHVGLVVGLVSVWSVPALVAADPADKQEKQPAAQAPASEKPRPIRVAVFDMDIVEGVDVKAPALTDYLNTAIAALPQVTVLNRDQITRVATEHKVALPGRQRLSRQARKVSFGPVHRGWPSEQNW
jgi:hypothetical protein